MRTPLPDLPPELIHYRDEGCHLYPACLTCPLSRCIYDEGPARRRRAQEGRDREVARLFRGGEKPGAIAHRFKISERTVYRILKRRQQWPS